MSDINEDDTEPKLSHAQTDWDQLKWSVSP